MKFDSEELAQLLYWIAERENVRKAKESRQRKPWTADRLIRNHRWCNVRRMDDLVSRQLLAGWYDLETDSVTDLIAALFARLINWPDSLSEILRHHSRTQFSLVCMAGASDVLHARAARGDKIFTGAYVIPGVLGKNKIDSITGLINGIFHSCQHSHITMSSAKRTWAALIEMDGIGSFLGGQVVADMAFLRVGRDWEDRATWAPVGPGSARGINRLLGRPKDRAIKQAEFESLLPFVIAEIQRMLPEIWADRKLIAMDIQNCLCEFDKFRRLILGEGKVRARYDGEGVAAGLFS